MSTGYPLHSPVSPSLPLPCVTVCHHVSTEVYQVSGKLSASIFRVTQSLSQDPVFWINESSFMLSWCHTTHQYMRSTAILNSFPDICFRDLNWHHLSKIRFHIYNTLIFFTSDRDNLYEHGIILYIKQVKPKITYSSKRFKHRIFTMLNLKVCIFNPVNYNYTKTSKDGAWPTLFHTGLYLCCSVVICVVLCTVCV